MGHCYFDMIPKPMPQPTQSLIQKALSLIQKRNENLPPIVGSRLHTIQASSTETQGFKLGLVQCFANCIQGAQTLPVSPVSIKLLKASNYRFFSCIFILKIYYSCYTTEQQTLKFAYDHRFWSECELFHTCVWPLAYSPPFVQLLRKDRLALLLNEMIKKNVLSSPKMGNTKMRSERPKIISRILPKRRILSIHIEIASRPFLIG